MMSLLYVLISMMTIFSYQISSIHAVSEYKNVPELIAAYGFKSETHTVQTSDDFLLTVHRIVNPYIKDRQNMKVFLLLHALGVNGAMYLINAEGWLDDNGVYHEYSGDEPIITVDCDPEPDQPNVNTPGFAYAACGYDVWVLHYRGERWSQRHAYKDRDDPDFWHFSFQENGWYDVPATIDYILKRTNKKSLSIMGHSQGTSVAMVYLAEHPEHANEKVNLVILASPAVFYGSYITKITGQWLYDISLGTVGRLVNYFVINFFDRPINFNWLLSLISFLYPSGDGNGDSMILNAVKSVMSYLFDSMSINGIMTLSIWNVTRLPAYAICVETFIPYQTVHYLQLFIKQDFVYEDRGSDQNMKLYNKEEPPKIPLHRVTHKKIVLIQGDKDISSDRDDIDKLKSQLHVSVIDDVDVPDFRHIDFEIGSRVGQEVVTRVLRWLKMHSKF